MHTLSILFCRWPGEFMGCCGFSCFLFALWLCVAATKMLELRMNKTVPWIIWVTSLLRPGSPQ